jgi:protein-S-isoprenylcysteine O-methyltransferase Ste14
MTIVPEPRSLLPRALFFNLTFLVAMIALALIRRRYWHRQREVLGQEFIKRESTLTELRQLLAMVAFLVMILHTIKPGLMPAMEATLPYWVRGIGALLTVLAIGLLHWVTREAMTLLQPPHHRTLMTTGIYGVVRHPLYAASSVVAIAMTILSANWVVAGLALVFIVDLVVRARRSDQRLAAEFGPAFTAYAASVPACIPRRRDLAQAIRGDD